MEIPSDACPTCVIHIERAAGDSSKTIQPPMLPGLLVLVAELALWTTGGLPAVHQCGFYLGSKADNHAAAEAAAGAQRPELP